MALNQREKYIAYLAVGSLVAVCGWTFGISPYIDAVRNTKTQQNAVSQQLDEDNLIRLRKNHLAPIYDQMKKNGLSLNESYAQSQARQAIDDSARAGINLDSVNLDRTMQESGFQISNFVVSFNVVGQLSMSKLGNMLWSLETAMIPLRVSDMKISTPKEGSDSLTIRLDVSALFEPPIEANSSAVGATNNTGGHS